MQLESKCKCLSFFTWLWKIAYKAYIVAWFHIIQTFSWLKTDSLSQQTLRHSKAVSHFITVSNMFYYLLSVVAQLGAVIQATTELVIIFQ